MTITIKVTDENSEKDIDLTLSNDDMNNANYVTLRVGEVLVDVPVQDLYQAMALFENMRVAEMRLMK